MNLLFIHQNFPAQYRHLVRFYAERQGNTVRFISQQNAYEMQGVEKLVYQIALPRTLNCHPLSVDLDLAIRNGAAVAELCRNLKDQGYRPDIVIGHAGWGETLFVKDVFPDTPVLAYFEFFYRAQGADVGFDPEYDSFFQDQSRLRTRNGVNFMAFDAADWGNTPTNFQKSLYPPVMRRRMTTIHEGVDTDLVRPDSNAAIKLMRDNIVLTPKDEVVTYVSRNLEPYRGFHVFMRAVPGILKKRPKAHIVIIGGDGVSYGSPSPPGTTFRQHLLGELGRSIDLSRVHFLGVVPYQAYLDVLRVSSAHIYLTYPFVLSWSFIEAMAAGCLVIGSRTPPVLEVLQDRVNGLTVDFFSVSQLVERIDEALERPKRMRELRLKARETAVTLFDLKRRQLPKWTSLINDLVAGRVPN